MKTANHLKKVRKSYEKWQSKFCTNLLSDKGLGGVLPLDDYTFNILQRKHPEVSLENANLLLEDPFQKSILVIFDQVTPELIRNVL